MGETISPKKKVSALNHPSVDRSLLTDLQVRTEKERVERDSREIRERDREESKDNAGKERTVESFKPE